MSRPTKGIAVDCGCRGGGLGHAEYRGILLQTGEVVFEYTIGGLCTNNIAELAALVHGVLYMQKNNIEGKVYSDSRTAISWYRKKKHKSNLRKSEQTSIAWALLERAILKVPDQNRMNFIDFWDNKIFGETPADYGRKT